MKAFLLFIILATLMLGACSQYTSADVAKQVAKIDEEAKRIEMFGNLQVKFDTATLNDSSGTIDKYFIDATHNKLLKAIRIVDTGIDTVKKYRLDRVSRDSLLKLKVTVDTLYYVSG